MRRFVGFGSDLEVARPMCFLGLDVLVLEQKSSDWMPPTPEEDAARVSSHGNQLSWTNPGAIQAEIYRSQRLRGLRSR